MFVRDKPIHRVGNIYHNRSSINRSNILFGYMQPGMQSMNNTGREVFVHPPVANIKPVGVKNNTKDKLIHPSPAYFKTSPGQ
jgi:hypothetical protein